MAGRYLITGVQLGQLQALAQTNSKDELLKLVQEIFDEQFVGNSTNSIKFDVKRMHI